MKRGPGRRNLLIVVLPLLAALLPLGCEHAQRIERTNDDPQESIQPTKGSTAASDSPTIRWLLRDAKPNS